VTITAPDIQEKQLSSRIKGFDREEVRSFFALVKEEVEALTKENAKLKEHRERIGKQLREYDNLDKALKDTLASALSMMEDFKNKAKKDAELIIREAESRARASIKKAQEELNTIQYDINELKDMRRQFKEAMNTLIVSSLASFNSRFQ
jgi:cell division initiation protein